MCQGLVATMVQAVKTSAPLRIGVIGVGIMGSQPRPRAGRAVRASSSSASPIPDRSQRDLVTRVLGCPAVNDFEALLHLGVDAVTIAAPTHLHHDIALTCIARGIHVLVEKPIASIGGGGPRASSPRPTRPASP